LSAAFLVLLETLTPAERAAFLLHDVLGYPHRQSARVIGTTELAARQLASRARRRVSRSRDQAATARDTSRATARRDPHAAELVARFIAATQEGDLDALLALLADDVSLSGDGGGNVPPGMSITKPLTGRHPVATLLLGYTRRSAPARLEAATVNGRPGVMVVADDEVGGGIVGTYAVAVEGGKITAVHGVVNPDKLRHLGPLADLDAFAAALKDARQRRSPGSRRA
jgi:RNA polymerase sigma-70 factor (ECF subfamily)